MNPEIAGKVVGKGKRKAESSAQSQPKTVSLPGPGQRGPTFRDPHLASKIAEDTIGMSLNFRFKNAEKHFPHEPTLRTVDKCYPRAKGGMLLVDEPNDDVSYKVCLRKGTVLKELGYRYLILRPSTDEFEARELLGAA